MKHTFIVFLFVAVFQTSSNAAVRAELSGSESNIVSSEQVALNSKIDTDSEGLPSETPAESAGKLLSEADTASTQSASTAAPAEEKPQSVTVAYQKTDDVSMVMRPREERSEHKSVGFIPMIGFGKFSGAWGVNTRNDYSAGLAVEVPLTSLFSIEAEGGYSSYQLAYTNTVAVGAAGFGHRFDQYLVGANAKMYFWRWTFIRPYLGAGIDAVIYDGMSHGPYDTNPATRNTLYTQVVGDAQLLGGVDIGLSESISLGLRGSWLVPVINKPYSPDVMGAAGLGAAPGYEEASLMNASFYRLQASIRVAL